MRRPYRPRQQPEAKPSGEVLKILGNRVWGRRDCMAGNLVRVSEIGITPEQVQWALDHGLAVWNGDHKAELEAEGRRSQAAAKSAAESTMQRYDSMPAEDRAFAREQSPEEGSDVV